MSFTAFVAQRWQMKVTPSPTSTRLADLGLLQNEQRFTGRGGGARRGTTAHRERARLRRVGNQARCVRARMTRAELMRHALTQALRGVNLCYSTLYSCNSRHAARTRRIVNGDVHSRVFLSVLPKRPSVGGCVPI